MTSLESLARSRWKLLLVVPFVVAVTSAALTWWTYPPAGNAHVRALVIAAMDRRVIEPRLSGGFTWAPLPRSTPPADRSRDKLLGLRQAALGIERADAAARTAATAHAVALAAVLLDDPSRAVSVMEEAVAIAPGTAAIRTDLAALYLARGMAGDRARALDEARRAIELNDAAPEAWFNLGLASEHSGLPDEAADAWRRYLSLDDRSPWSDEARRHLQSSQARPAAMDEADYRARFKSTLAAGTASQFDALVMEAPLLAQRCFEDEVVTWATSVMSDAPPPPNRVNRLQQVGTALRMTTGDRMASTAAARLSTLEPSKPATRAVAASLLLFERARQLYLADRVSEASSIFQQALPSLAAHGHPVALWVRYYLAVDQYYRGDLRGAAKILRSVEAEAETRGFVALGAQVLWMLGLTDFTAGRFLQALDAYDRAVIRGRRLKDHESVAALQNLRAEVFDALGESTLAWEAREEALSWLPARGNPRRIHTILRATARAARAQGRLHAALAFQNAGLENARLWKREGALLEAIVGRAQVLSDLNRHDAATKDIEDAIARLARITDPVLGRRFAIDVYTALGEIAARRGSSQAVPALSEAIARLDWAQAEFARARLYLLRGRAQLIAGQQARATDDFLLGARIAERQRRATPGERLRLLAAARLWELHNELALVELQRGATDNALEMLERGRALSFLDGRMPNEDEFSLDAPSLRPMLAEAVVLYYAVLPTRVLCWTLSRSERRLSDIAVSPQQLRTMVRSHSSLAESGVDSTALDRTSRQLYDLLIRPTIAGIPNGQQILVVADDELYGLAFASLRDYVTQQYLIEQHPIAVGPSLRMLAVADAAARRAPPNAARLLVVGNPTIASGAEMPRLKEAQEEAVNIAGLYPNARVLIGHEATREAVLHNLENVDIFHYAGHAIANPTLPSLSRLVLAGDRTVTSGAILADEIAGAVLAYPRLVILAACRTADGALYRGEGIASVARPFLAAGVPVVIAGLWDVDDRASRELFERFHRRLSTGDSVSMALRAAQLSMLRDDDARFHQVGAWAAFEPLGVPSVRAVKRRPADQARVPRPIETSH